MSQFNNHCIHLSRSVDMTIPFVDYDLIAVFYFDPSIWWRPFFPTPWSPSAHPNLRSSFAFGDFPYPH